MSTLGWVAGYALLPAYAYWLQDYKMMQLGPMCLIPCLLTWFYFLDESARWQIATGQTAKAEVTLRKALKMNGKSDQHLKQDLNDLSNYLMRV